MTENPWIKVRSTDSRGRALADRHYSRQKPGSRRWIKPSRCFGLIVPGATATLAAWASSWPLPEYVKHAWPGAWECSLFRNESTLLASELIRWAVAATLHVWGEPPALGMITFIDPAKVKPTMVRGKPTWGYCYLKAGWKPIGVTGAGKITLAIGPSEMPEAASPYVEQLSVMDILER